MLFDGGLDESDKNTHQGTSFTKQFEILLRSRQRRSQSMAIDNGSACLSQQRHFWRRQKRSTANGVQHVYRQWYFQMVAIHNRCRQKQKRINIQRKIDVREKYRCRQRASIRCVLHAK